MSLKNIKLKKKQNITIDVIGKYKPSKSIQARFDALEKGNLLHKRSSF